MTSDRPWILVVEDDPHAREGLLELLASSGCDARSAGNGQEALDLLESGPRPILILVDLMLPLVTGWDLLKYLHDDPDLRLVPVIVMTAATGDSLQVIADEIFLKPLDLPRLLDSVERIVNRSGS